MKISASFLPLIVLVTGISRGEEESAGKEAYESAIEVFQGNRRDESPLGILLSESSFGKEKERGWELLREASEAGHPGASLTLSWADILNFKLDDQLVESLKHLADEFGEPDAQFALGFMYATGLLVNSSQARAMVHYTFGAFGGSPLALMSMGYRSWAGIGIRKSCENALYYYRKVAQSVSEEVNFSSGTLVQRIRLLDEADSTGLHQGFLDSDRIDYYQFLAENGDVHIQVGLGRLYYQGGRGVERDHALAFRYFQRAADAGNSMAMAYLGKLFLEGGVIEQSNESAYLFFQKSSEAGDPIGQTGMGILYLEGRYVEKDYHKAMNYFLQAAEQNFAEGQLELGNMFFKGLGVKKDYKTAVKNFILASQSGNILAYYYLAEMHATGVGTLRSCSAAVELYKIVGERGRWAGLMMSAHMDYRAGRTDKAVIKYLLLAEAGSEVAQANVAYILDQKESKMFESNEMLKRALVYWSRSASQGYSAARVRLGDYYYYGLGTPVDFETAAFHYRIASEQSNAQAMFNLGYMHELGMGMKRDIHLAKRFYDMAWVNTADAAVPVSFALAKLSIIFALTKWFDSKDGLLSPGLINNFNKFWDLYLCAVLVATVGVLFFIRQNRRIVRTRNSVQRSGDNNEEPVQDAGQ